MEEREKIEKYFQEEGKHLVAYYIQSRVKSELRGIEILKSIEKGKIK